MGHRPDRPDAQEAVTFEEAGTSTIYCSLGIYAFDSVDGVFEHSYASGSADGGYYVGQCQDCRAILNQVTAEWNGFGFSGGLVHRHLTPRFRRPRTGARWTSETR